MKTQTKKIIFNVLDQLLVRSTIDNLRVWRAIQDTISIMLFVLFFTIFMTGINDNLFSGFFEYYVALGIMLIVFYLLEIFSINGILGYGNIIFLTFGIVGAILGENSISQAGIQVLITTYAITFLALIYDLVRRRRLNYNG